MSTKIIFIALLIIAMTTLISAQVTHVECAKDSDCGNGEVCQKIGNPSDWYCISTSGETQSTPTNEINTDYTPIIVASIIGVCVIIGFIILAIILKKRNK